MGFKTLFKKKSSGAAKTALVQVGSSSSKTKKKSKREDDDDCVRSITSEVVSDLSSEMSFGCDDDTNGIAENHSNYNFESYLHDTRGSAGSVPTDDENHISTSPFHKMYHHDYASYGIKKNNNTVVSSSSSSVRTCPPRTMTAASNNISSSNNVDDSSEDHSKYGYGDAAPDTTDKDNNNMYGYGDGTPDSSNDDDKSKYGYGDAAPSGFRNNNDGGGGGGTSSITSCSSSRRRTPRRSSMKSTESSEHRRPARRASIQLRGEIENVLPGSNGKKVKRRTSITFNDSVAVKPVAPVKDLTDNPEALWFQDDEFHRMKQKAFDIVEKVDQGLTGGKKYCIRGLESLSSHSREEKMNRKYDAWDSVLNEQKSQRCYNQYDDDHLANICKFSTIQSQKDATERANRDAAEVEKYLQSARRQYRRRCSM